MGKRNVPAPIAGDVGGYSCRSMRRTMSGDQLEHPLCRLVCDPSAGDPGPGFDAHQRHGPRPLRGRGQPVHIQCRPCPKPHARRGTRLTKQSRRSGFGAAGRLGRRNTDDGIARGFSQRRHVIAKPYHRDQPVNFLLRGRNLPQSHRRFGNPATMQARVLMRSGPVTMVFKDTNPFPHDHHRHVRRPLQAIRREGPAGRLDVGIGRYEGRRVGRDDLFRPLTEDLHLNRRAARGPQHSFEGQNRDQRPAPVIRRAPTPRPPRADLWYEGGIGPQVKGSRRLHIEMAMDQHGGRSCAILDRRPDACLGQACRRSHSFQV